jgi:hypothetical protein
MSEFQRSDRPGNATLGDTFGRVRETINLSSNHTLFAVQMVARKAAAEVTLLDQFVSSRCGKQSSTFVRPQPSLRSGRIALMPRVETSNFLEIQSSLRL